MFGSGALVEGYRFGGNSRPVKGTREPVRHGESAGNRNNDEQEGQRHQEDRGENVIVRSAKMDIARETIGKGAVAP